ncbi:MAG: YhcN/YlaJ family sporulation lipoprotein [Brevibacillus sp.]|nr:YhcN/YlaJ family sporulation lipoprotein [Brevibacillus sp.]
MKKSWLYSTITCFALLVSACANNATPDNNTTYGLSSNPRPTGYTDGYRPVPPGNYLDNNGPMAARNGRAYQSLYKSSGIRNADRKDAFGTTNGGLNDTANMTRMGFVKVDRNMLQDGTMNNIYLDRDALAQIVGNVTASVPGVNTSTVLVTDEEIFVGLDLANRKQADSIKKKAKMNAWSVSPRWFKVYVTDNRQTIADLSRIASRTADVNAAGYHDDTRIDNLIRRFGGVTDGEDWPEASGMTKEMRDRMDIGDAMEGQQKKQRSSR